MCALTQLDANETELSAFADVIRATSTVATLICIGDHGLPFTRIWCLHELDLTFRAGGDKLQLLASKGESSCLLSCRANSLFQCFTTQCGA